MAHRLPGKSAVGPANRAPTHAPAGKVATTRDCCAEVMVHIPTEGLNFPNVHDQSCMAWMPEMTTVS